MKVRCNDCGEFNWSFEEYCSRCSGSLCKKQAYAADDNRVFNCYLSR